MALDLKNISDYLDSPEAKESIKKHFEELDQKEKHYAEQVERFYQKHKDNMVAIIEKIIAKYDSDAYVNREYKLGYEPREDLYWVLKDIAAKYGEEIRSTKKNIHKWRKYLNMFTGEAYVYMGYFIQVMHGQGSVVKVEKIDNSRAAMKAWEEKERKFKEQMEKLKNE